MNKLDVYKMKVDRFINVMLLEVSEQSARVTFAFVTMMQHPLLFYK